MKHRILMITAHKEVHLRIDLLQIARLFHLLYDDGRLGKQIAEIDISAEDFFQLYARLARILFTAQDLRRTDIVVDNPQNSCRYQPNGNYADQDDTGKQSFSILHGTQQPHDLSLNRQFST